MASKLQQAPGALEQVRAFVNTAELHDEQDQLSTGVALARWLSEHGLSPQGLRASRDDLDRATRLREAIRAILLAHSSGAAPPGAASEALDQAARRARLRLHFQPDGTATLEPDAGGVDGALGRLVAIVHDAIAQGTWERLKACRDPTCQWVFYDHTKNRSGSWCTMVLCGNRAKARAYRSRQKEATDPPPSTRAPARAPSP